jgi:anaerobic selenocysteine-containing dehydrogenase
MQATDAPRTVRTMCPMSCHPTLCGMLATVQGGELLKVEGDRDNPDSRGFLCIRGQASREVYGNPARLLTPLVRDARGQPLRRAGWDEALDRIAASMRAAPPAATAWWPGHGSFTTNYGTRLAAALMARFANLHGSQFWSPTIVCWGLGAFGLALTGVLETNTKEDLGEHADLVLMWGANLASQPNTAPHLMAAKARGAHIATIDVRHTEAAAKSDEVFVLRPGSDGALALAMLHVVCGERLHDADFVAAHTLGFDWLATQVERFSPAWAEGLTGIAAERIVALARRYAGTRRAVIVLGGSSMHKGANGWQASRAIACLPAITGKLGIAGGGLGPRHGSASHGRGLNDIALRSRRPADSPAMPNQMSGIVRALQAGEVLTLMLMGTNMLSSFADTAAVEDGLARVGLIVSHDLFLNETAERFADVVLPSTAWLEELGCKASNTHLYLMERALPPAGETRSAADVVRALGGRLGLADLYPWASEEAFIDALIEHPSTGHATVAALRAEGGMRAMKIDPVAYPTRRFDTPSGKVELWSESALALGLPALPDWRDEPPPGDPLQHPLLLTQGRTLAHFHGFYNNGRELPTLARREREPQLWMAPADANARSIADGAALRLFNERGSLAARAHVTPRMGAGAVWLRDGWPGLNRLTSGEPVLPDAAVDRFAFGAGQARYDARVEVERI